MCSSDLKVVDERRTAADYSVDFEAPGGAVYDLPVRLNRSGIAASARMSSGRVHVVFPQGAGFQRQTVRFSW